MILQKYKIRIVNFSQGVSDELIFNGLIRKFPFYKALWNYGKLKERAREEARIIVEETELFFRSNPDTIFVMASGNEGKDIGDIRFHTSHIRANNLVTVASIDAKTRMKGSSNRSSIFVDIGAIGVGVSSSKVGGGHIFMSGTSQAAPKVTNALAFLLEKNKSLTPEMAILKLYSNLSSKKRTLENTIAQGRVLSESDLRSQQEGELGLDQQNRDHAENLLDQCAKTLQ